MGDVESVVMGRKCGDGFMEQTGNTCFIESIMGNGHSAVKIKTACLSYKTSTSVGIKYRNAHASFNFTTLYIIGIVYFFFLTVFLPRFAESRISGFFLYSFVVFYLYFGGELSHGKTPY
jgi:hypothetical protein